MSEARLASAGDATIRLRNPTVKDAAAIWCKVESVGNLERNSCYAYLLLCSHFAETCLLAERGEELLGFVLAYRPPSEAEAVFVWQVGVLPTARGTGLGRRLLSGLLHLPACRDARFLVATVSPDNRASLALFQGLARALGVGCVNQPGYAGVLFAGPHPDENIVRLGPLKGTT